MRAGHLNSPVTHPLRRHGGHDGSGRHEAGRELQVLLRANLPTRAAGALTRPTVDERQAPQVDLSVFSWARRFEHLKPFSPELR